MNARIFHFVLTYAVAAAALSSCTSQNAGVSREQIDNSMKNAGTTWHTAVDKTSESMKELGPKLDTAKQQARPALDKAEQSVKNVGGDLGKVGSQFGNAIDNTAKDIKHEFSQPAASKPTHKHAK